MLEQVEQYIKDHETDFVDRLDTLLKIPSISTASEHAGHIRQACDFVKDQLLDAGVETVVLETAKRHALDSCPGLRALDERCYGDTRVTRLEAVAADPGLPEEAAVRSASGKLGLGLGKEAVR